MTKAELIDAIALHADLTKREAGLALDATMDAITASLKHGEDVTLQGFGTFAVKQRESRTGRNPATGAAIQIPASKTVGFKAGWTLKVAVS